MHKSQFNKEIIVDNSSRLPKFQTRTVITEENGRKIVYKYTSNPDALPFLKLIVDKEKNNADYLKEHFSVLCGTLKENYIEYEYLPFRLLKDLIRQKMCDGDVQGANSLFDRYVQKVTALETEKVVPEEFLKSIADEKVGKKRSFRCLLRGLLDLTPRNIMVDGDRWIVIDNEWSFDFPVPVEFILFRSIRDTAIVLQDQIRRIASELAPVTNKLAYGYHDLYMPVKWLECLENEEKISLSQLMRWELGFKRYVVGQKCFGVGRVKRFPRVRTSFPNFCQKSRSRLIDVIKMIAKVIHRLRRFLKRLERLGSGNQ